MDLHAWVDAIVRVNVDATATVIIGAVTDKLYAKVNTVASALDVALNAKIWVDVDVLKIITLNANVDANGLAKAHVGLDVNAIVVAVQADVNLHATANINALVKIN